VFRSKVSFPIVDDEEKNEKISRNRLSIFKLQGNRIL